MDRKLLCERPCPQYETQVKLYIEIGEHKPGAWQLAAEYEGSRPPFKAAIPDDWSIEDVLILVDGPGSKLCPAWELPAAL